MSEEKLCLTLPKTLKDKAKEIASKKNLSLNALIRLAISEFIERNI